MPAVQQTLSMPNPSTGNPPATEVKHYGQIVIVGANGSGKSRLGAWLENPFSLMQNHGPASGAAQSKSGYRIGAQRVLTLPDQGQRMDFEQANSQLANGGDGPGHRVSRLSGDPVVGQSNDFALLLNTLFAEQAKSAREYRARGRADGNPGFPKEDTLERLKKLWERIFPERELIIGEITVQAKPKDGGTTYSASALSDGERVGFYLIAHTLLAPPNARLIIDEPELHLHESIQSSLWDALEAAREDCVFVYITHDLGFAASRNQATKIVLYDYTAPATPDDVGIWTWNLVPKAQNFPEDIVLRILGSRRPTVFVEGLVGSLDQEVYEALFPDKYIVPCGSCNAVERAVRAFQLQPDLHHLSISGIIDRDDRSPNEIAALLEKRIHVLPVAAIENLLALTECITKYATSLNIAETDIPNRIQDGQRRVHAAMKRVRLDTIAERAQYALSKRLRKVSRNGSTKQDLVTAVGETIASVDPSVEYDRAEATVDEALKGNADQAYEGTLMVFRNKAVLAELAAAFGASRDKYTLSVIRALRVDASLRTAILDRLSIPA